MVDTGTQRAMGRMWLRVTDSAAQGQRRARYGSHECRCR